LVGAIVARLVLLSVADLSFAVPMMAVGYVISVVTGKFFLHEAVSLERWIGAGMILAATLLVGSTPRKTQNQKSY
ncbi:MAG: EamA family transporter, partial [Acidobacteriaceae bacterium]|nr:EamA family transporter [Acidobacteriaceae bacterium]